MSHPHQPQLPAELLDYIVDHLCDSRKDLESCCLISKSWVPRIRSRIFSKIKFRTIGRVKSWKNTFPDPSTSPACYTKSLLIYCPQVTMSVNAVEGGWIPTFSGVVDLEIAGCPPSFSPVPFHGFSPVLTSLRISLYVFQPSQILDLVCSFPLLEDVSIYSFETRLVDGDDNVNEQPTALQSRSSPMLTGTLELSMQQGIDPIASGLLSLPNGLRFRKLDLTWHVEQAVSLTTALVERCYPTLEFLKVDCTFLDPSMIGGINLHKATKLKDVVFECEPEPRCILATLQTITEDHRMLQQITLFMPSLLRHSPVGPAGGRHTIERTTYEEWSELDRFIVLLWESHSTRLRIRYGQPFQMNAARGWMEILFPEATKGGIVDVVR